MHASTLQGFLGHLRRLTDPNRSRELSDKGAIATKYTATLMLLVSMGFVAALGTCMASSLSPSTPQKAPSPQTSDNRSEKRSQTRKSRVDQFGDPLPEDALARLGTVRFRHGGQIDCMAFSPDGKVLASGGWDNAVRLWEVATGKQIRRFTPARGRGAENAWVESVAFSRDGKRLAAGTGNAGHDLVVWELATGKEMRRFQDIRRHMTSVAFTPDGEGLAASDVVGRIRLWRIADGEVIREFKGHPDRVETIALSPDGKILASAGQDKTIRLWDASTGRELRQLTGHTRMIQTIAFAPDGKKLASGGLDQTIRLWDAATGKMLHALKGHQAQVCGLAFFPDGKRLASGGGDGERGVRFWDIDAGKELPQMRGPQGAVSALAISPDGETLAFNSGRIVRVWDLAKGEERRPTKGNKGELWFVAVSPDGRRIATGGQDETIRLWDSSTGIEMLHLLEPKERIAQFTFHLSPGSYLQFAADGKTVIVSRGYKLGRWRADTGEHVQHRDYDCISLLPTRDGKFVIEREQRGIFYLTDAATGKKLRRFPASRSPWASASTPAISPDGRFLAINAAEENGTVVIWELATGKERCRCKSASHLAYALEFSPDGKYLASPMTRVEVYEPENSIYLWDAATGREVRQFRTRGHFVTCLSYSSDGRMLASGGGDKTVRLWEVATGKERQCFEGHQGSVRSVAFAPDGKQLASASDDTTALVWDVADSTPTTNLTAKDMQDLWSDLAGKDASVAFRAIRRLAAAPEQSLPFLCEHLKPVPAPDLKRVRQLVEMLDNEEFQTRQKATEELDKYADTAADLLRQIAMKENPSLEVRRRLQQILEDIDSNPETLRVIRAVEVLEWIATPEAARWIGELANGAADARLTREAVAAKRRLSR